MNNLFQPFAIASYHLKHFVRTPRIWVLFSLSVLYLHSLLDPLVFFAKDVGFKPTPWLFPFLVNDFVFSMILSFGAVILFADAPFRTDMENYFLLRSNYCYWRIGQIIYIISASFIYLFSTIFICNFILIIGSGMEWSWGWGKVLGTLSNTNAASFYSIDIRFNGYIYSNFTPFGANAYTILLEWLLFITIGMFSYVLNYYVKYMGSIFTTVFVVLDIAIINAYPYVVNHISPVSLAKLSIVTGNKAQGFPSIRYSILFFSTIIILTSILGVIRPKKRQKFQRRERG